MPAAPANLRSALDRLLGGFVALLLGMLVVDVLWQVVSRFVLGAPSVWTEELARYLLVWLGLFGAAYAVGQRRHLAVDLLATRVGARGKRRIDRIGLVAVGMFALLVLMAGGASLVRLVADLGQRSAAIGIPLSAVYAALPMSGLLTAVYVVLDLLAWEDAVPESAATEESAS